MSLTAAGVAFTDGWWRIAVAATVTACVVMRVALGWLPLSKLEAWSAWFHWMRNGCTRGQRNRP